MEFQRDSQATAIAFAILVKVRCPILRLSSELGLDFLYSKEHNSMKQLHLSVEHDRTREICPD
jgi:hypothetical protein